ncbi:MAG: twitching motility protein PilT, partial [Nitrosopumilaceae archaeon]|nr:twitching motility protein PilT [Nitrosopumilaceae archaeon]
MVDVICDTSFLIHLANHRIKNLATLDTDIGFIQFLVPDTVISELNKLAKQEEKSKEANNTIQYIKNFKKINIGGSFADDSILKHVRNNGGVIATIDKELKYKIKNNGGSVISIANN